MYVLYVLNLNCDWDNELSIDPEGYFANLQGYCRLRKLCLYVNFVKFFVSPCLNSWQIRHRDPALILVR